MKRLKGVVLVICVCLHLQSIQGSVDRTLQYYGFVGCVFSRTLCHVDEKCINDGLFGSCQRSGENHDHYWYQLNRNQLVELERVLYHLATSGYTWRHLYTQCRVMSTLLSYRYDIRLRNDFCKRGQQETGQRNEDSNYDSSDQLIDDLIDMLSAKLSLADKEEMSAVDYKRFGNQKEGRSTTVAYNNEADQQSEEMLERILKHLSDSDMKVLKEFLVQQRYGDDYSLNKKNDLKKIKMPIEPSFNESVVVKKVDSEKSGSATKIVIDYDPEARLSSEDNESIELSGLVKDDKVIDEETSSSVSAVWSMAPSTIGGLMLESQSTMGSVPSIEAVPLQGRMNEQASHSPASVNNEFNSTFVENAEMMQQDSGGVMIALFVLCGLLVVLVIAGITLVVMRHNYHLKEKLLITSDDKCRKEEPDITDDLQDLCRENMRKKLEEDKPCLVFTKPSIAAAESGKSLQRNSTASTWSGDQMTSRMDISTGHMVLSYMEDHLSNKDKLDEDWKLLCSYDSEPGLIVAAVEPANGRKNRYDDILPYDQTRVRLNPVANVNSSDYINASTITDDDPRYPTYIAAQGPLPNTVADFWQMIWEQGSTTVVCLTTCTLVENDVGVCFRYWPTDGSDLYHIYEVMLFEEHRQKHNDFIIRTFCLRNTDTNETRTVTQFHYLSWPSFGIPASIETLLDFRRKVNSSYHGRFCPIIVHCSDGAGQTGAYCLIDMVLNRIDKGAREMDIAATLEHIRDQRVNMVRTKEQFEFCLMAIVSEVENRLKVNPSR